MTPLLTAILSVLAGILGATLTHALSVKKSRNDELARMRLEAYTDFLKSISRLVASRRTGNTVDDIAELAALNDAKTRICVCADEAVVNALTNFWMQGGTLEREQEVLAFAQLCRAMRASLGSIRLSTGSSLPDILFKLEPSTYSHRRNRDQSRL